MSNLVTLHCERSGSQNKSKPENLEIVGFPNSTLDFFRANFPMESRASRREVRKPNYLYSAGIFKIFL